MKQRRRRRTPLRVVVDIRAIVRVPAGCVLYVLEGTNPRVKDILVEDGGRVFFGPPPEGALQQ